MGWYRTNCKYIRHPLTFICSPHLVVFRLTSTEASSSIERAALSCFSLRRIGGLILSALKHWSRLQSSCTQNMYYALETWKLVVIWFKTKFGLCWESESSSSSWWPALAVTCKFVETQRSTGAYPLQIPCARYDLNEWKTNDPHLCFWLYYPKMSDKYLPIWCQNLHRFVSSYTEFRLAYQYKCTDCTYYWRNLPRLPTHNALKIFNICREHKNLTSTSNVKHLKSVDDNPSLDI